MKTTATRQAGFEHVTIGIFIVVIVVVGFASYRVLRHKSNVPNQVTTPQTPIPNKIQSKADIRQASKALDAQDVDKQLDPSQLDKNITDLL